MQAAVDQPSSVCIRSLCGSVGRSVSVAAMAFDPTKWWEMAFGPQGKAAKTRTPSTMTSTRGDETETEESTERTERTESEAEKSGPPSDASKDIGSDDTMMDVHSQILEVSHRSVLARPHPPPIYRGKVSMRSFSLIRFRRYP